jgi:hypothetical protein
METKENIEPQEEIVNEMANSHMSISPKYKNSTNRKIHLPHRNESDEKQNSLPNIE